MKNDGLKTTDELDTITWADDAARAVVYHATDATREYENVQASLASTMDYCHRELGRALADLKATGRVPNSLGVLQGNGVEVDRLCGELIRTRQAAAAAQSLLRKLGITN